MIVVLTPPELPPKAHVPPPADVFSYLHLDKVFDLDTLLGAVLASVAFSILAVSARAMINGVRPLFVKDRLYGRWHHHFINNKGGQPVFRHERLKIRAGFLKKMVFETDSPDRPNGKYSGEVIREKDFVILYSKATDDEERIFQRFHLPPVGADRVFVGVSCPQDYDGHASVHACVMANYKIPEDEFLQIVRSRVSVNPDYRIMTVKGAYGI